MNLSLRMRKIFSDTINCYILLLNEMHQCWVKPRSHCPGSTPVCPGEGKPVYRHKPGIIFLKNDFVLTFPVLPRCSYGFRNEGPRWSHGSSRFYPGFIPVSPGSTCTTVRPGVAPVVHGAVPVTAGRVTVCAGGVTVLPRFATVRPGLPRCVGQSITSSANAATMAPYT